MEYDRLYKRTAAGAVQVWWMERDQGHYRTLYGQEGGEILSSEWTKAKPKNQGRTNATTPIEQAEREVASAYKLKRKQGYYHDRDEAVADTKFRPMLAKKYEDYREKIQFPVYSQPKLDGIRCVATRDGLFSRAGNPIVAVPHVVEALEAIFRNRPFAVLDGELYNHTFADDFNTLVSLVKKQKPSVDDLGRSRLLIQYHVYDYVADAPFSERFECLGDMRLDEQAPLRLVHTERAHTPEELDGRYEHYLNLGYEGQIVRLNGPYEQKRSKLLLKRKEFLDKEFQVLEIHEGEGNRSGMAGYAVLSLDGNGRTFRANIKGDRAFLRTVLAKRDTFLGKPATVEYFKPTPDGVPRFPRIKAFHPSKRW
jgi:DNA ligase 1